jgi:hypothetical protein
MSQHLSKVYVVLVQEVLTNIASKRETCLSNPYDALDLLLGNQLLYGMASQLITPATCLV